MTQMHSHVWVGIVSSLHADDWASAKDLRLLQYQDSDSLSDVQQISLTMSGRFDAGDYRRPLREILSVGDLIRTAGYCWDGVSGDPYALSDAIITDVQVAESLTESGYTFTTQISAQGLQSLLTTDTVAWWMFYGTQIGALQARGVLMQDDISGHIDKVFATYLNKVAFNFSSWNRDGKSLKERMSYRLSCINANIPFAYNLQIAEGSHWGILSNYAESPFHEFFVQMRAPGYPDASSGFAHAAAAPGVIASTDPTQTDNGAVPCIVLRPAPFPHLPIGGGAADLRAWEALPMHDVTGKGRTTGTHQFGRTLSNVRNFFLAMPGFELMNDQLGYAFASSLVNVENVSRFSYRPMQIKTNLLLNDGPKNDFITQSKLLTWRLAGQWNRQEDMSSGSVSLPFSPHIQKGERLRFRMIQSDEAEGSIWQGYITARNHSHVTSTGGGTTVTLERCLPESAYLDPAYFAQGLTLAQTSWEQVVPFHKPGT